MKKIKCAVGALVVLVVYSAATTGFLLFIVEPIFAYISENHEAIANTVGPVLLVVSAIALVVTLWYALYEECMNRHKRGKK